MKTRNAILALAIGATLAFDASTASARMVGQSDSVGSSASSHYSAAALKALDLRWEAIAKSYRLQHAHGTGSVTRPDDRAGVRGV